MKVSSNKKRRSLCARKVYIPTIYAAWQIAAELLVTKERMLVPYKCPYGKRKPHYHLTHKFTLTDPTNIPQEYRQLYLSYKEQQEYVPRETFWDRLRSMLV